MQQRIDVYSSTDPKKFGNVTAAGNPIPQSLASNGTWVAIPFEPVTAPLISVTGSPLNYNFIINDMGSQSFVPFDIANTYVAPTFKPLVT